MIIFQYILGLYACELRYDESSSFHTCNYLNNVINWYEMVKCKQCVKIRAHLIEIVQCRFNPCWISSQKFEHILEGSKQLDVSSEKKVIRERRQNQVLVFLKTQSPTVWILQSIGFVKSCTGMHWRTVMSNCNKFMRSLIKCLIHSKKSNWLENHYQSICEFKCGGWGRRGHMLNNHWVTNYRFVIDVSSTKILKSLKISTRVSNITLIST